MKTLFCVLLGLAFIYLMAIVCREAGADMKRTVELTIPHASAPKPPFEQLLDAMEFVESGGNKHAVGDNGKAIGSFQIHSIYVDDVNRILQSTYQHKAYKFKYEDRHNYWYSKCMVKHYLEHYATKERIGREPTFEDIARIHNGGPNGWKKDSTKAYWQKVKKRLYE